MPVSPSWRPRPGQDFLKIWLAVDGPEQILAWAGAIDPRIDWENRYNHHCDACRAIYDYALVRDVLAQHWRQRRDDVLFRYRLANDPQYRNDVGRPDPASSLPVFASSNQEDTIHGRQ